VDAVLLKPLPFHDPDRLLAVWEKKLGQKQQKMFVASGNFPRVGAAESHAGGAGGHPGNPRDLTSGPNGRIDPQELKGERATAGLFPLLGRPAGGGRTFCPKRTPGRRPSALLSYELFQTRFKAILSRQKVKPEISFRASENGRSEHSRPNGSKFLDDHFWESGKWAGEKMGIQNYADLPRYFFDTGNVSAMITNTGKFGVGWRQAETKNRRT